MKKYRLLWVIFRVLVGAVAMWYGKPYVSSYLSTTQRWRSILWADVTEEQKYITDIHSIYSLLEHGYFDKEKLSLSGMREWWVKWFVNAVGDPYTEYFTTDENADFITALKGEEDFEWIGAAVAKKEWGVQIQEVYKWTPAALVGLQPLDMVLSISGTKTDDLTLQEAVDMIRGPEWTSVELLIYRASRKDDGKNGIFTVQPIRQKVEIPSVQGESIALPQNKGNICYIEISVIGDMTDNALAKELFTCEKDDPQWYVIDLRGNGGGYLQKWVDIASHFLPKGVPVVSAKYSMFPSETYTTIEDGRYKGKPIVVLIDGLTASAGEIVAWALQQNVQAKLVGTSTFGKWSIQTVMSVGSGAWLKYTVGMRYLPDDTNIDKEGIKPDIEVVFDTESYQETMKDNQKDEAITTLAEMVQ